MKTLTKGPYIAFLSGVLISAAIVFSPSLSLAQAGSPAPGDSDLLDFDKMDKAVGDTNTSPQARPPEAMPDNGSEKLPETVKHNDVPPTVVPPPVAPAPVVAPSVATAPAATAAPVVPPSEVQPPPPEIIEEGNSAPPPPPTEIEETTPLIKNKKKKTARAKPRPALSISDDATIENNSSVSSSDAKNEARFARIYEKYNTGSTGDDEWSKIAGEKASETYNLQKGDTLWDVSTTFFGTGYYWPKVWQINDDITNPHSVKVGGSLHFSPGSTSNAPSVSVSSNTTVTTSLASGQVIDEEGTPEIDSLPTQKVPEGNQIIIPPSKHMHEPITVIPQSFPAWQGQQVTNFDSNGFERDVLANRLKIKFLKSVVPSVISEVPWQADGKVVQMEGDTTVASTYQKIIVQLKSPSQKGAVFTAYATNGNIVDDMTGQVAGVEIETRAELEVIEPIAGTTDLYRVLVRYTASPVQLNDHIKLGALVTRADFNKKGVMSTVGARIVNGEMNDRRVFGLHAVVFLDRGSDDGLQVDSLLPILENVQLRNNHSLLKIDPNPIGLLKVVNVSAKVSTAVVVDEKEAVYPGDETALVGSNEVKEGEEFHSVEEPENNAPPPVSDDDPTSLLDDAKKSGSR